MLLTVLVLLLRKEKLCKSRSPQRSCYQFEEIFQKGNKNEIAHPLNCSQSKIATKRFANQLCPNRFR